MRQQSRADADEIEAQWCELERMGRAAIEEEGVASEDIELFRVADVRYVGEGHEVSVAIKPGTTGRAAIDFMWEDFHRVHDEAFGFEYKGEQDVELVNLRVQAVGRASRPDVKTKASGGAPARPNGSRQVFWRETGWIDCPIHDREQLTVGQQVDGPTIVEEYGSTIVVPTNWSARMDQFGNLVLEKRQ